MERSPSSQADSRLALHGIPRH